MFQINDRVIATGKIDGLDAEGQTGTVVYWNLDARGPLGGYCIGIEFDNQFSQSLHDCKGSGMDARCWFGTRADLARIKLLQETDFEFEESEELHNFLSEFANTRKGE